MKKLAVVTGTRAEYGLLRPLLFKLLRSEVVQPALVVTGSHLSEAFGSTVGEIEADRIPIAARVDILSDPVPDGRAGTARRTSLALGRFLDCFEGDRPDALLVLGDRYEAFAAAQAAALLDIPVIHISGGEVTRGADDEWFRHCISKMAKLHFPSCELHRERLLRMGEMPGRVHNVGGLGDENIRSMELMSRPTLAESLGLPLERPYALVTMHPETATNLPPEQQADVLLGAVERHPEIDYIFTKANADAGGSTLNERYAAFCEQTPGAVLFSSLGALRYLSAMQHAALVLGNSSSGVVETPSFGVPTVNVGCRQDGRMVCANVICAPMETQAIAESMEVALSPAFRERAARAKSPYNGGDTSGRILTIIEEALAGDVLAQPKEFYDGEAGV